VGGNEKRGGDAVLVKGEPRDATCNNNELEKFMVKKGIVESERTHDKEIRGNHPEKVQPQEFSENCKCRRHKRRLVTESPEGNVYTNEIKYREKQGADGLELQKRGKKRKKQQIGRSIPGERTTLPLGHQKMHSVLTHKGIKRRSEKKSRTTVSLGRQE